MRAKLLVLDCQRMTCETQRRVMGWANSASAGSVSFYAHAPGSHLGPEFAVACARSAHGEARGRSPPGRMHRAFRGATPEGDRVACTWKSWAKGEGRRWSFAECFPMSAMEKIRRQRGCTAISTSIGRSGLPSSPSLASTLARQRDVEQEWWASTRALIALLLHCCGARKFRSVRSKCATIGRAFLEFCLGMSVATGMELFEGVPENVLNACSKAPVVDGKCMHWGILVASAASARNGGDSSPQSRVWFELAALAGALPCEAAARRIRGAIDTIALSIEESVSALGDFAWHKSGDAMVQGRCKRRRLDPHVRSWCADSLDKGEMATHALVVRSLEHVAPGIGCKWLSEAMAEFRAEMHLASSPWRSPSRPTAPAWATSRGSSW